MTPHISRQRRLALSAIGLTLGGMTLPIVRAAETRTLKIAYFIGDKHPLASSGVRVFVDEVKKATGGKIDFRIFPSGQLGKPADSIKLLQSGLADIALIVTQYHREEFALTNALNLPWGWSPWELTNIFMRTTSQEGPIRDEWRKVGLVPLVSGTNPPYEVHTKDRSLPGLASLKGLKIRSPGGLYDEIIKALGATPVAVPTPETFEAVSRGTVDATIYAFSNWGSYRLQEILRHTTVNMNLPGASGLCFAMTERNLASMSPEERAIMLRAGRKASLAAQEALMSENESSLAEFKGKGLNVYKWSEADVAALRLKLDSTNLAWAKNVDAAGKPGSRTLELLSAHYKTVAGAPRDFPTL